MVAQTNIHYHLKRFHICSLYLNKARKKQIKLFHILPGQIRLQRMLLAGDNKKINKLGVIIKG